MLDGRAARQDFADLKLPFQCVAASIESASARWFTSGPVVPAVMASCAVPGLLPPVEIDGAHYFDGGLVDSIPVGPGRGARRQHRVRAAGGPDREPAGGAHPPLGSGAGGVRDRPAAPVPRGDVLAARPTSGCTSCRPAATGSRPVWRSSVTGTRPRWGQYRASLRGVGEVSRHANRVVTCPCLRYPAFVGREGCWCSHPGWSAGSC